ALNALQLTLYAGEHAVIRGGNGAGKSTLLRLLRGEQWPDQIPPEAGQTIRQAGQVVWHTAEGPQHAPLAGRTITALVSAAVQEKAIHQEWRVTGEELVAGGFTDSIYCANPPTAAQQDILRTTVAALGAEALLPKRITTLSQGQLRLLLVARALVRRAPLTLLDEVTDGLDAHARQVLLAALGSASHLSTLVMTTHRPETLPDWITREIVLEAGQVLPNAPCQHSLTTPKPQGAQKALAMTSRTTPAAVPALHPPVVPAPLKVIRGCSVCVCIKNATVFIDREPVLHALDWTIKPGENWAVIGRNGAGKSTLLRLLAGDEIVAWGGSIEHTLPRQGGVVKQLEVLRKSIRLVSDLQQATYGYDISGEELVFSGIDNAVGVYRDASPVEREQVAGLLSALQLSFLAKRSIRSCSTGQLRRLLLARALAGEPDLLLLDEPFSGLDEPSRAAFVALLEQVALQGVQMVLVTHHEADMFPAITHVLELHRGRIVRQEKRS
ncbi:MAG: ATP-binding cassette domain-containing protein, partial [Bilophila sp.]